MFVMRTQEAARAVVVSVAVITRSRMNSPRTRHETLLFLV
jgi:hypothetical protein